MGVVRMLQRGAVLGLALFGLVQGGPGSTSVSDNVNKFTLSTRQILNRSDLPWMHAKQAASSLGGLRQGTGSRTPLETSRAATKAVTSDLKEPFCLPASLA